MVPRKADSRGMADSPRLRAVVAIPALWSLALAATGHGQGTDFIDTGALGDRGVVLEMVGPGRSSLGDLAGIGDFNGDGFDDFAAAGYEDTDTHAQVVYLIFGRPGFVSGQRPGGDLERTLIFRLADYPTTGSGAGHVYPVGDLDGDGLADFLFALDWYVATPGLGRGAMFLVHGDRELQGDWLFEDVAGRIKGARFYSSDAQTSGLGLDAALLGDINGDGEKDLAMAQGSLDFGVHVLLGTDGLPGAIDVAEDVGTSRPGVFVRLWDRAAVSDVGDFNGDGLDDFAVSDERYVFIVRGRTEFPPVLDLRDSAARDRAGGVWTIEKPVHENSLYFGKPGQFTGIGDLNGDGLADVLVASSAWALDLGAHEPLRSEVYVFYGRADFPAYVNFAAVPEGLGTRIVADVGGLSDSAFGRQVAAAGDPNGDGIPDFLIGAPRAFARRGEAYLVYGKRDFGTTLELDRPFAGARITTREDFQYLGFSVAAAGDANGDGFLDYLVGARISLPLVLGELHGKIYLIYGTGAGEAPLTLTGISPEAGPLRGGTTVTLRGSGFTPGAAVLFGERAAASVTMITPSELEAVTPPGERFGEVAVLVRDRGDLAQLPAGFVYRENLPEVNLEDPGQLGLRIDGEVSFWTGRTLSFGDVTGDGIDDLVVGSKAPGAWIVSIVPGGANLRNGTLLFEDYPAIREETETSGYVHAAIAGDVDGDGILDIGIGYSGVGGTIVFGGARLAEYRGGVAEILENGGGVRLPSPFGFFCFVRLRDVTGDGIDDFAVVLADNGEEAGRLHLVAGRRDWEMELDLSSSPQVFSTVMGPGAWFGIQAATVGDADGDGLWDVLVNGSPEVSDASCFLLRVSAALPRRAEIRDLVAGGAATEFVRKGKEYEGLLEVAGPGDVNGDGIADLLIADSRGGGNWSGVSFLIPGGDFPSEIELPSVQEDPEDGILRVTGSGYLAYSGMFIGPAADFNADGFADFLVSEVDKRDPRDSFHYNVIFGSETPSGAINLGRLREHGILMRGAHEQVGAAGTTQGTGDLNGDGIKDFAFAEEGVDWVLAGGHGGPEVIKSDSPGAVYVVFGPSRETPFRRGDCDGDGGVKGQVTDAVFLLNYNFLQGPEPPCLAACDANGDGSVLGQVTDAVFLLTYNFLQGPEPPAPFPDCGAGGTPSDAALGCTTAGACP